MLGIQYARKKMIRMARTTKRLSIQRQQHFYHAPEIDIEQMGTIVMPFIPMKSWLFVSILFKISVTEDSITIAARLSLSDISLCRP